MNKKSTYILIAILLVLVALYGWQKYRDGRVAMEIVENKKLINFSVDEINNVNIKIPGNTFDIQKQGTTWVMRGYPTLENEISDFITSLEDGILASVASINMGDIKEYGLDDDTNEIFILKNNDKVLGKIILGTKNINSGVVYLLRQDEKRIFVLNNFKPSVLANQWVSLLVEKTDKALVQKVGITTKDFKTEIAKSGDAYRVNGRWANQAKIDDLLNRVTKITAAQIPDETSTFSDFDTKIEITASTTPTILELAKKDDQGNFYWIKNSAGRLYILDKETYSLIVKQEKELK